MLQGKHLNYCFKRVVETLFYLQEYQNVYLAQMKTKKKKKKYAFNFLCVKNNDF